MTQDEIIRSPIGREQLVAMAREAGFDVEEGLFPFEAAEDKYIGTERILERFAALVAAYSERVKRPQNCGTGYCSCIECVMEPVAIPDHITCPFCESDHVPDWLHDLKLDAKAIRALKLVYDNSTSHDWPEDIWEAIEEALK